MGNGVAEKVRRNAIERKILRLTFRSLKNQQFVMNKCYKLSSC